MVGRNGRMRDSAVWASSGMRAALESNTLNIPEPQKLPNSNTTASLVIVADEGFGLKDYVMRPYSVRDASRDRKKRVFNYRSGFRLIRNFIDKPDLLLGH